MLSLALGIAATSTVGSIVHAVLLRALPFSSPARLVLIGEAQASSPEMWQVSSYPDFLDWTSQARRVFEDLAVSRPWGPTLRLPATSTRLDGAEVSADFFPLLGVRPALGRLLGPSDFHPAAEPVVVLSHQLWIRRFGGDRALLGQPIYLDGTPSTVVGILPEEIALDEPVVSGRADLLRPLVVPPGSPYAGRGFRALRALGRLRRGVTVERARIELRQVGRRLAAAYPETNRDVRTRVEPLREVAVAGSRPVLLALLGAAVLLLLIACFNAAHLRLVALTARRQEFAVRSALGAGRARLFRQLLRESLPLLAMAFGSGLLLTVWAWDLFVALLPPSLVRISGLALDGSTVAITALVTLITFLLIDLLPFLELSRLPLVTMLAGSSARSSESSSSRRGRNALVAAELALSLALLIGAGLLLRSLLLLSRVDLGFRPERVVSLSLDLSSPAYAEPARARGFLTALVEALEHRPGVRSAALVVNLPLAQGGNMSTGVALRPKAPLDWQIDLNGVSPGYFSTLGTPLLRGRDFTARETRDDQHPVVILNATAARRLWPGENPLGKRVILDWMNPMPREVVGVVGDQRTVSPEMPPHPEAYLPYPQIFFGSIHLVLHADPKAPSGEALAGEIRREVKALDPGLPLDEVVPLETLAASKVAAPVTDARVLGCFALTGLLLAATGVYGVTSFTVAQKKRDLGIRMALGARGSDVTRTILSQSAPWAALGLLLGIGGGVLLSRLLASLLFQIDPLDPGTFVLMPLILLATALWAGYGPVRRAVLLDPRQTLSES